MNQSKDKSIKDLLAIMYDETCDKILEDQDIFDNRDARNKVRRILEGNVNYNLTGLMGIGKTTGVIKIAHMYKIPIVLAFPLNIIISDMTQFCDKNKINYNVVKSLSGSYKPIDYRVRADEIKEFDSNIIFCLYDNITSLLDSSHFNTQNYCLVIDEAHNIITSFNYRDKAIKRILYAKSQFKNVVNMTGTPEGIYYNELPERKILLKKAIINNTNRNTLINIVGFKTNGLKKLLHFIIKNPKEGVTVILINNKDILPKFEKALLNYYSNPGEVIVDSNLISLSSKSKDQFIFKELARLNKLPANTKFFITTSVIAEGLNIIDENIKTLYMFDIGDWWQKRQFISRFRLGVDEVYDFESYNDEKEEHWLEINQYRIEMQQEADETAKSLNNRKIRNIGQAQNLTGRVLNEFYLVLNGNGKYERSSELINYVIVSELNRIMQSDKSKAIEFYNDIALYSNVRFDYYDDLKSVSDFNPRDYIISSEVYDETILLNQFPQLFYTFILLKYPVSLAKPCFDINLVVEDIDLVAYKELFDEYYKTKSVAKNLFDDLLDAVNMGFPKEVIYDLAALKLNSKTISLKSKLNTFKFTFLLDYMLRYDDLCYEIIESKIFPEVNILWEMFNKYKDITPILNHEAESTFNKLIEKYSANINYSYDEMLNGIFDLGKSYTNKNYSCQVRSNKGIKGIDSFMDMINYDPNLYNKLHNPGYFIILNNLSSPILNELSNIQHTQLELITHKLAFQGISNGIKSINITDL